MKKKALQPGAVIPVKVGGVEYETVIDRNGTQRFRENPDNELLRSAPRIRNSHGELWPDLNEMAVRYQQGQFSQRAYAEMNMAFGYSVAGFEELSSFQDMKIENPLWDATPTEQTPPLASLADLLPHSPWEAPILTYLRENADEDSAHDIGHLMRVLANARHIAAQESDVCIDTLTAAALLHDLVNLPKNHPQRALASLHSAEQAATVLKRMGFPDNRITGVKHAIVAHSFSAGIAPETLEACIVQDADRIEALGHIGIARCFAVSGKLGRALFHPTDPMARHRELDEPKWAMDHFQVKLATLPATMKTNTGRALANERWQVMVDFLAGIEASTLAMKPAEQVEPARSPSP